MYVLFSGQRANHFAKEAVGLILIVQNVSKMVCLI